MIGSSARWHAPAWVRAADGALTLAVQRVRLIQAVTPRNLDSELDAAERSFAAGAPCLPAFRYEPRPAPRELRDALERLAQFVQGEGIIGALYAARALELSLESEMVAAVGTHRLAGLARIRFVGQTPQDLADFAEADRLALDWAEQTPPSARESPDDILTSDPNDPRSLLSAMMAEIGRRRVPVRVVVQPGLASLAATGDGVVLVAAGRRVGIEDVERTVLHEIEGHVMPRVRASAHEMGIFAVGTARGVDDQEGRALLLERAMGFLGPQRRRELALRHLAAKAVLDGADFVQVVRMLMLLGCTLRDALWIGARVQRGGAQSGGGIAREIVYLPGMLRVERAMSTGNGEIEQLMANGRVSADAAVMLQSRGEPAFHRHTPTQAASSDEE